MSNKVIEENYLKKGKLSFKYHNITCVSNTG